MEGDPYAFWTLLVTFVLNAGLTLLVGSIASLVWLRYGRSDWSATIRAQSSTCVGVGVALCLIASGCDLWLRSASAAGVTVLDAWPAVSTMVGTSHYGKAWAAGMTVLTALAAIHRYYRPREHRPQRRLLTSFVVCVATFIVTRSVVSHASANGDFSIAVAVDSLHVALIALWVGMVFVASLVRLRSPRRTQEGSAELAAWIHALSAAATVSLIGILLTGAFNTWRGTAGALSSLPGSAYGAVLLVKLLFVTVAVALGAHNRFRSLPGLLQELRTATIGTNKLSSFIAVIRVEAFVLAAALAAAAVLSSTEPSAMS